MEYNFKEAQVNDKYFIDSFDSYYLYNTIYKYICYRNKIEEIESTGNHIYIVGRSSGCNNITYSAFKIVKANSKEEAINKYDENRIYKELSEAEIIAELTETKNTIKNPIRKQYVSSYINDNKCDDIKPTERRLFRFLIKQINYSKREESKVKFIKPTSELLEFFSNKYNVSYKKLLYYLRKWNKIGFWRYNDKLDDGCFAHLFNLLYIGDKYQRYTDMVPKRVKNNYFLLSPGEYLRKMRQRYGGIL